MRHLKGNHEELNQEKGLARRGADRHSLVGLFLGVQVIMSN